MAPVLHVLDVGHGNSAVMIDEDSIVIFDAGPRTTLLEFLHQEQIHHVDTVLISHADKDHVEGLISLIESETVTITRVRLNPNLVKKTEIWSDLNYLLEQKDRAGELDFVPSLTTKQSGEFDTANVHVEILAPSTGMAATGVGSKRQGKLRVTSNSISVVVRLLVCGQPRIILMGDVSLNSLVEMLTYVHDTTAEIMVYPHHGGHSDRDDPRMFAQTLCNAVKPKSVIFSIGRGLHGTPLPPVVSEIRKLVPTVRICCTQLSEHCAASPPISVPTHLGPRYSAGSLHGKCCGGTITINLNAALSQLQPTLDSHAKFIQLNAPTALCK
jgi:beta-lactamase superfamily II metal-dependent hydrolase